MVCCGDQGNIKRTSGPASALLIPSWAWVTRHNFAAMITNNFIMIQPSLESCSLTKLLWCRLTLIIVIVEEIIETFQNSNQDYCYNFSALEIDIVRKLLILEFGGNRAGFVFVSMCNQPDHPAWADRGAVILVIKMTMTQLLCLREGPHTTHCTRGHEAGQGRHHKCTMGNWWKWQWESLTISINRKVNIAKMLLSTLILAFAFKIAHSAVVLDLRSPLSGLHLYCHEIETSSA